MKLVGSALGLLFGSLAAATAVGCGGGEPSTSSGGSSPTSTTSSSSTTTTTGTGGTGTGGTSGTGGTGGAPTADCLPATGPGSTGSNTWPDGSASASVTVQDTASCTRTYVLSTTGPLRDNNPANPRTYAEKAGQPVVRTGHDMLDALYALAVEETREASVDAISDGAFNGGAPLPCPQGGCFETGRLWKYVWTRDTSYSVALGLGLYDPKRAQNSMEFKLSLRRDGTRLEIVQDTGTGGSWPISSDRVVWAMGAWELLKVLDGADRTAFRDRAYEAIVNTAERDRLVVWDAKDGLYRGEQSFLDWREQSYPGWTATDTVQIGMSKALGTNIAHLTLLDVAEKLAAEKGDTAAGQKYGAWKGALADAIRARFWLDDRKAYSSFITTYLDPAPTQRFDLLGSALAVLSDVATPAQAAEVVARYPHLPKGAPVIWPQQQDTPIYHNRAIWPFVTAFWAKAAAKAGNADAVGHALTSLVRGAALNLSNMENFEAVTGANWLDDGPNSGPVVNSQRQLWSVAGYLGVMNEVLFGLEMTQSGIRFAPRIPRAVRSGLLSGADSIALSNLTYKGKRVSVRVKLPASTPPESGMLEVLSARLDGKDVGLGFVDATMLGANSVFEIDLGPGTAGAQGITLLSDAQTADYKNVFGPRTPVVTNVSISNDRVKVDLTVSESANDVTFNVYRDGVRVAEGLPGNTTSWVDQGSAQHASVTYCYSAEAVFASGNASQHASPSCYWGPNTKRIQTLGAPSFVAQGGTYSMAHGLAHYDDWGDPTDSLMIGNIAAGQSGRHLLQVLAGNGAGGYTTGITCAVKAIEIWDGAILVGSGQLMMPQLGTWDDWRSSSFVPVDLVAGKTYGVVIREDAASGNMSDFAHFASYSGMGGAGGRFNKVNISDLKVLAIGAP